MVYGMQARQQRGTPRRVTGAIALDFCDQTLVKDGHGWHQELHPN
jgi:hypothetical protein